MKKMLVVLAAAAMVFTACSKDDGGAQGPMRVTIDPTITRATEVDFETNDAIGVTITTAQAEYAANKKFIYGNGQFAADGGGLLWYEDINAKSTLFAYYPYAEATPAEFTVAADQNGDGYAASDLMTAFKQDVYPSKAAVGMTFRHKMARLILTVDNETDFPVTRLVVKGSVGTAVVDASQNTVTAKADGALLDIQTREVTPNAKYYVLMVPQSVKFTVAVTTAEGERTQGYTETELVGGKSYPVTVRVKPANMEVTMSGPIDSWEDADEIPTEGQGSVPGLEYGGVKYKIITLKDGRTWMAENLRYVPEGKTVSSTPGDGNGVWYPCNLDRAADPDLAATNGLLYSYPTLLGMTGEFTSDNFDKQEGVRGICPEGWHIPTLAEWLKVTGVGSGSLSDPTSPYYTTEQAGAPIPALNADGFNIAGCGFINATGSTAKGVYMATKSAADASVFGMGYFAGSTAYKITYNTADDAASGIKNIQYYTGMLTYNVTYNRLTVAYQGAYSAAPVRCIKDRE